MRLAAGLVGAALVAASCSAPTVSAADCEHFRTAFAAPAPDDLGARAEALTALESRFPGHALGTYGDAYARAEAGFVASDSTEQAFATALDLAVAMHALSDVAPVDGPLAEAVPAACAGVRTEVVSLGPDARTPEPETTVGLDADGVVDQFVSTLAAAHERTDGAGCAVLREGLAIDVAAAAVPHVAADAFSGEVGCLFADPTGPVLLVVVAVDGEVAQRLRPLVTRPGRVVGVEDVFGLARAQGLAVFDAGSDGWLVVLTPGTPDPREALDRLVASLG